MFIKPAPGIQIPDPDLGDLLPEVGRKVIESPYWTRRLRDGDVLLAKPPKQSDREAK